MCERDHRGRPRHLDEYVDTLVAKVRPRAVVLFGSRARGEEDRYSDYDLLVISDELPADLWQRLDLLWQDKPADVDVLGFTVEELEACLHRGLILDALLDGVTLVGNIKDWCERASAYLAESGLVRTPYGYFHPS
ncbi:MAG: nucleotidyltransferase domain-containing protein [Chloroflexi bacterium]|nr:nucleotidyltransferase domain-containing protein [Chloroflexota bacterium]